MIPVKDHNGSTKLKDETTSWTSDALSATKLTGKGGIYLLAGAIDPVC